MEQEDKTGYWRRSNLLLTKHIWAIKPSPGMPLHEKQLKTVRGGHFYSASKSANKYVFFQDESGLSKSLRDIFIHNPQSLCRVALAAEWQSFLALDTLCSILLVNDIWRAPSLHLCRLLVLPISLLPQIECMCVRGKLLTVTVNIYYETSWLLRPRNWGIKKCIFSQMSTYSSHFLKIHWGGRWRIE